MLVVNLPMLRASEKNAELQGVVIGYDSVEEFAETNKLWKVVQRTSCKVLGCFIIRNWKYRIFVSASRNKAEASLGTATLRMIGRLCPL